MNYLPILLLVLTAGVHSMAQDELKPAMLSSLMYEDTLYFDFGKADLKADADSVLLLLMEARTHNSDREEIIIKAHTDAIGDPQSNLKLSQKRAESVKKLLLSAGIPDSVITLDVYGETMPAVNNDTESGRQQNRRAIISLIRYRPTVMISGHIQDKSEGKDLPAHITIRGVDFLDTFQTKKNGQFNRVVPRNANLLMDVHAPGHFYQTKPFNTLGSTIPKLEVKLSLVKKGERIDIENLYFLGNEAILVKGAERELPKILKFMKLNPNMKIEIEGHVNLPNQPPADTNTFHYQLSVDRAKFLYNYLIENDVDPNRMQYKGYGNSRMRYPKAIEEKYMRLNSRVEISVLETGETLSKEKSPQQE